MDNQVNTPRDLHVQAKIHNHTTPPGRECAIVIRIHHVFYSYLQTGEDEMRNSVCEGSARRMKTARSSIRVYTLSESNQRKRRDQSTTRRQVGCVLIYVWHRNRRGNVAREREGGNVAREREGGNAAREREGGNVARERGGGNVAREREIMRSLTTTASGSPKMTHRHSVMSSTRSKTMTPLEI